MNIFKKVKSQKSKVKSQSRSHSLSTRHFRLSTSSGFTLVETLVAIAILMIAIAGPLTVAEKGLSASIYARDQLMASYLAQDAMESIKNIVDSNELAGNPWLSSLSNYNCTSSSLCTIDTTVSPPTITTCGGPTCTSLYLSPSGYTMTGGSPNVPANFTRSFYIQTFSVNGGNNNAAGEVVGGVGVKLENTMFDTKLQ